MKKYKFVFIFLPFVAMWGCNVNSTFLNREEDKTDAERITAKFHQLVKGKYFAQTIPLFSDSFYNITPKETLMNIFSMTTDSLGLFRSAKLAKWETKVVEGSNPSSEYALQYNSSYEHFPAVETFRLIKEKNGQIKILFYNISSDGFLKK